MAFTAVQPGSVTLPNAGTDVVVVSKVVPAGSYAINAKVSLQNKDDDDVANTDCALKAGGAFVNVSSLLTLGPNTGGQELDHVGDSKELPLQGDVANFGGGAIALECEEISASDRVDANKPVLTAIKVGSVQ